MAALLVTLALPYLSSSSFVDDLKCSSNISEEEAIVGRPRIDPHGDVSALLDLAERMIEYAKTHGGRLPTDRSIPCVDKLTAGMLLLVP